MSKRDEDVNARTRKPYAHAGTLTPRTLERWALLELEDGLLQQEPLALDRCVEFVLAESRGLGHGRARAKMCRRLKHCDLGRKQRAHLLECILGRLVEGRFSEQFKDQLRLAMHLNLQHTLEVSARCVASSKPYVRRYAAWVLSHQRDAAGVRTSLG